MLTIYFSIILCLIFPKNKCARENSINDLFRLKAIILHRDTLKIDMQ